MKTILRSEFWIHPELPSLGVIDFWGHGFLKNMIRNLVGSAIEVACGNLTLVEIKSAFEHGDRKRTGPCAPGHALCLKRVFYHEKELQEAVNLGPKSAFLL